LEKTTFQSRYVSSWHDLPKRDKQATGRRIATIAPGPHAGAIQSELQVNVERHRMLHLPKHKEKPAATRPGSP
jgi:hypothetical protein